MLRSPCTARHLPPGEANDLLWLTRTLLTGNAAHAAHLRGRPEEFAHVPPHKRLINAPPERGLPIGNLTSQFFANVYLNELDQYVKHQLKCRHYLRYVDDFVLVHEDPCQLDAWRDAIICFLNEHLGLALRDAGRLRPAADGIDFLGYIVRRDYRLVRRRVVGHLREKLEGFRPAAAGLSWPIDRFDSVARRFSRVGWRVARVAEDGWLKGGLKRRVLRAIVSAAAAPRGDAPIGRRLDNGRMR